MKKSVTSVLVAIVAACLIGRASAQQIPSGEFSMKVTGPPGTTNIGSVEVSWPDSSAALTIEYSASGGGDMKNMTFRYPGVRYSCVSAASGGISNDTNAAPQKEDVRMFVDLNSWIGFSKKVQARFVRLSPKVWVETEAFKFIGETVLGGQPGSTNETHLFVFEGGKHLRVIDVKSWIGGSPVKGKSLLSLNRVVSGPENLIGFTDDGKYFFLVDKQKNGGYFLDQGAAKIIYKE